MGRGDEIDVAPAEDTLSHAGGRWYKCTLNQWLSIRQGFDGGQRSFGDIRLVSLKCGLGLCFHSSFVRPVSSDIRLRLHLGSYSSFIQGRSGTQRIFGRQLRFVVWAVQACSRRRCLFPYITSN